MMRSLVCGLIGLFAFVLAACGGGATSTSVPATVTLAATGDLVTHGQRFEFQLVCINRNFPSCKLLSKEGGFVERVFQRTEGQVDMQISSFPELGLAGPDTMRLIENGTIELGEIYSGYVGGDAPIVDLANLWGLFPDTETNVAVIDATREDLRRIMQEKSGGVVLLENYFPYNYYFSKRPLRTLEDFKGMKTRSHSTVLDDLIEGMGADPQFVALAETYAALERGMLDAAVSCGTCGSGMAWYEVSDYLVGPIVVIGFSWLTINQDRWDEMPQDIQAIILDEAARYQAESLLLATTVWNQDAVDANVAQGMEYIEFTPEVKAALREAALSKVLPRWIERTGGPDSEAARIFNEKAGPILKVRVLADGTAQEFK